MKEATLTGLSGVGILWLVVALFSVNWSFAVIMITALIATIVGGLAGGSGFYLKQAIDKK